MASSSYLVVLVSVPAASAAPFIKTLLKHRVAACVNEIPQVRSTYWWKGTLETARETLLIIKTKKAAFKRLVALVEKNHPSSVPEILALPIQAGNRAYLKWLEKECRS